MMSDYNFLEEVGRTVDNAARENIKLEAGSGSHSGRKKVFGPNGVVTVSGGNNRRERNNNRNKNQGHQDGGDEEEDKSVAGLAQKAAQDLEKLGAEGSGSYKDKQLIMQAKKRGTHLIMMADGLKKRKENHTNWKDKLNKLNWTIEWLFPEMDSTRRILEHKNDDSLTLTTLLIGALSKDENKDIAAKYPIDTLDQCRLYFVIPLRHANQPALYPLATAASLQEALKFKKVLEYPTILVLGPNNSASSNVTQTVPPTSEQQDPTTSTLTVAETDLNAEKGEPTLVTETATEETEGTTASDTKVLVTDKDKSINTTTTTVTVVYPVPTDHTHPLLEKYTIEEPPSQWPKRPTPTNNSNNQNNKRQNDTPAVTASNKKSKVDSEGKEDVEMSASSDDSSDDDSDSDDSSSDDDSSDDSSDSSDNDKDEKEDAAVATNEIADEQEDDTTEQEDVDLKIGQAILEAFNQDFGGAAE
ncbi:hypothetical protein EC991_002417 [Linnemannia zychae]|nr:hypothetical protein EC991_002417 [Linnemannia zychae]